jgi:dTDP-4-dehydrorhamnose 3,5-epimerase
MQIDTTAIPDVLVLTPKKTGDNRGFFSETFRQDVLMEAGIRETWVQDNHSLSTRAGVVRGLHWQISPHVQAKLLRVTRGAIVDVVVDIRKGSPTFGHHVAIELSADNWRQIFVPTGFAHGFCTLTEECEVLYKVTAPYAPEHEGGLLWNDPALGIEWPVAVGQATLSERDKKWPTLAVLQTPFLYEQRRA